MRPAVRTTSKPKSARKSCGKTVLWTRKRSYARLALGVAVRERLEPARAAVARLADRREEERLQHPGARRRDEVRARDEDRVVARQARPAARWRAGTQPPARTASSRARGRPSRSRRCRTRRTRARASPSSGPCRLPAARGSATRCTRGRRSAPSRASASSAPSGAEPRPQGLWMSSTTTCTDSGRTSAMRSR